MKTIKFNLIVNDEVIRNIEDLKENFNIDDIYELYQNGVLQKWLEVRNYKEILEEVNSIDSSLEDKEIVIELLNVFEFDTSKVDFESWSFSYRKEYNDYVNKLAENDDSLKSVILEYHQRYEELKNKLKNPVFNKERASFIKKNSFTEKEDDTEVEDFDFVKATVNEIAENYLELFKLDAVRFYNVNMKERPIVIMACLMNYKLREIFLNHVNIKNSLSSGYNSSTMHDLLSPHLIEYQGNTEGMWNYLGDANREYLVIFITPASCRAGEQHSLNVDYSGEELNGKYKLLKGLTFKSTDAYHKIRYMEV